MEDRTIICVQCDNTFVFTASEQARFIALGFDEPKRCEECRKKKVKGGLSRYEEKLRHKNRQSKNQWERLYDLRRVPDTLIVTYGRNKNTSTPH